jgi:hypothetical protein
MAILLELIKAGFKSYVFKANISNKL